MKTFITTVCIIVGLLNLHTTQAQEWNRGGHLKLSSYYSEYPDNSVLGPLDNQTINAINLRLTADKAYTPFDVVVHYELISLYDNRDTLTNRPISDAARLLDLTDVIIGEDYQQLTQRFDRLSVGYTSSNLVLRFGRQAVSWGNGFAFNPMDIFNPFSPVAIDKDYKTGDDMIYAQWLNKAGNDWQFIVLPRRDTNHDIEQNESSYATKYHGLTRYADLDLLIAKHYDDDLLGVGLTKTIGESLWRIDLTVTQLDNGDTFNSLVTNMDYSWVWLNHNYYGYIELYHNGFGDDADTPSPNVELMARLTRGELFTHNTDYLSLGLQIELHPLVLFSPSIIVNLNDNSGLLPITLNFDWQQNLTIRSSLILSYGDDESEYGGPLSPGNSLDVLLSYYF